MVVKIVVILAALVVVVVVKLVVLDVAVVVGQDVAAFVMDVPEHVLVGVLAIARLVVLGSVLAHAAIDAMDVAGLVLERHVLPYATQPVQQHAALGAVVAQAHVREIAPVRVQAIVQQQQVMELCNG